MMMPSMVSSERILLARMACRAMRKLSQIMTRFQRRVVCLSFTITPSRRRMVRRAWVAMSSSWVTRTMVLPVELSSLKRVMISSDVLESRLPVGSSARMMERAVDQGSRHRHSLTLAARKLVGLMLDPVPEADPFKGFEGHFPSFGGGYPGVDQGQLHVGQGGGPTEEVEGLEDKADFAVADMGELGVVETGNGVTVEDVLGRWSGCRGSR